MTLNKTIDKKENQVINNKTENLKKIKSPEEIISYLKIKRNVYKNIMTDLLLDKMESNPELVHSINNIKKNLKFEQKYIPCTCNQYLEFEDKMFYLYISNDGIHVAFIIKDIDDKNT